MIIGGQEVKWHWGYGTVDLCPFFSSGESIKVFFFNYRTTRDTQDRIGVYVNRDPRITRVPGAVALFLVESYDLVGTDVSVTFNDRTQAKFKDFEKIS